MPPSIVELISRQIARADNAQERIIAEGEIVEDCNGNIVPHPAIAIERAATECVCDLMATLST